MSDESNGLNLGESTAICGTSRNNTSRRCILAPLPRGLESIWPSPSSRNSYTSRGTSARLMSNGYVGVSYCVLGDLFGIPMWPYPKDQPAANAGFVDALNKWAGLYLQGTFVCGDALTIADYCAVAILYVAVSPKVKEKTGFERPSDLKVRHGLLAAEHRRRSSSDRPSRACFTERVDTPMCATRCPSLRCIIVTSSTSPGLSRTMALAPA